MVFRIKIFCKNCLPYTFRCMLVFMSLLMYAYVQLGLTKYGSIFMFCLASCLYARCGTLNQAARTEANKQSIIQYLLPFWDRKFKLCFLFKTCFQYVERSSQYFLNNKSVQTYHLEVWYQLLPLTLFGFRLALIDQNYAQRHSSWDQFLFFLCTRNLGMIQHVHISRQ